MFWTDLSGSFQKRQEDYNWHLNWLPKPTRRSTHDRHQIYCNLARQIETHQ
jgi:hypothetical protein